MKRRPNKNFLHLSIIVFYFLIDIRITNAQEIAVLQPDRITILQYIMDDRPILVNLLTTAGLVPALSSESSYTLLAPPEQTLISLQKESPDKIREVLTRYVLKGKYLENDFKDGATVETLSGSKLNIWRKNGTLLNGVKLIDSDLQVRNGVVHQLQGMLQ